MNKELNCMNCCIGDFKESLCDCDNGICKEYKKVGKSEDFEKEVLKRTNPKTVEWIPCSERLPKIEEQVLCCDSQSRVFTSALTEIASNGMTFFGQHRKVIAWMPLPKPYKEENEE